jgi:hypothetical protein
MCDLFGGGGTTETTQQTEYAPWISQAQQGAFGMALAQNLPDLMRSGQYSHAGFNMDQQKGFDSVRNMLNQWGPGTDTAAGARGMLGQVGDYIGRGSNATAAQLSPDAYREFMNPYVQDVLVPATNELQRQTENARAGAGAGNFYEETVYAAEGANYCYGLRLFIHSTNIGNYEPGTVEEFDRGALEDVFALMRESFTMVK